MITISFVNAKAVVAQLREMKPKEAARKVEDGVEEPLDLLRFPLRALDPDSHQQCD